MSTEVSIVYQLRVNKFFIEGIHERLTSHDPINQWSIDQVGYVLG